jgi:hypothetical protein
MPQAGWLKPVGIWFTDDKGTGMDSTEPTRQELGVIEAEWPLIAAELAVVDVHSGTTLDGVA